MNLTSRKKDFKDGLNRNFKSSNKTLYAVIAITAVFITIGIFLAKWKH